MTTPPSHEATPVGRALRGALWAAWLVYSLRLFAGPFWWHAEQFRNPGEVYFKAFLISMPVWLLGCACYALLRRSRREWRGWELPALALAPLSIGFVYEPRAMAAICGLAVGAYGWGAAVLARAKVEARSALERVALPLGCGLVAWMVALYPLGLLGGLRPWVTVVAFAAGVWLGRDALWRLPEAFGQLRRQWMEDATLGTALAGYTAPWLFALANLSVLTALAPSRVFDVIRHHLFDAMMYASWGALRPVEGVNYSFYPQGVELLMAVVLPFGGQTGAQLAPALFFPVLLMLVWLIARGCGADRREALLGIALAASVPAVHWTSSVAKNDAALAVCLALGLYAYLRFLEERDNRVMLWGAAMLAAAMHVKQPAIFGGFALTILFLHAVWISRDRLRLLAGIAVIALVIVPAYPLRSWWFKGDPFFPQSASIVVGDAVKDYKTKKVSGWRVRDVFPEINFDGVAAWEFTSTSKNPLGASLIVFAPLLLLVRPTSRRWWAVVVFVLIYYAMWASVLSMVRYILLPLCVSLALLASQFGEAWERGRIPMRTSLGAALTFCLLFGLWGTLLVEVNAPVLAYFAKRIDRGQYLAAMTADYASLAATVRMAGPNDPIHGIGNCMAAYAGNPQRFSCEPCDFRRSCSPETIGQRIASGQYRWLILSRRPAFRGAADPWVQRGKAKLVFEDQYYTVYELRH